MNNLKYVLMEQVVFDRYDDGAMITAPGAENIICLGKFECDILDILLSNNLEESLRILLDNYDGDTIENDVVEFCDSLCTLGVMKKEYI